MISRGTIFFDAQCGLCTAGARKWQRILNRHGFELMPIHSQDDGFPDQILMRLHNQQQLAGIDVIKYVSRFIWWAFPCHLMLQIPHFHPVGDFLYRAIARRRKMLSTWCRLDPK